MFHKVSRTSYIDNSKHETWKMVRVFIIKIERNVEKFILKSSELHLEQVESYISTLFFSIFSFFVLIIVKIIATITTKFVNHFHLHSVTFIQETQDARRMDCYINKHGQ